jgi:hypothetical protein
MIFFCFPFMTFLPLAHKESQNSSTPPTHSSPTTHKSTQIIPPSSHLHKSSSCRSTTLSHTKPSSTQSLRLLHDHTESQEVTAIALQRFEAQDCGDRRPPCSWPAPSNESPPLRPLSLYVIGHGILAGNYLAKWHDLPSSQSLMCETTASRHGS